MTAGRALQTFNITGTGNPTSTTGATSVTLKGYFDVTFQGGVGTVKLEKTYDGTNWFDVSQDAGGTQASYVLTAGLELSFVGFEPAENVSYRFNCTAYTSGTIVGILVN